MEKLCNDNILIARLDSKKNSYILILVYIPPNQQHDLIMNDALNKLNMVKNRYKIVNLLYLKILTLTEKDLKIK